MRLRSPRPAELRGAAWAVRALCSTRRQLGAGRVTEVRLPPPRGIPASGQAGVRVVLVLARASCLERALVRQRWEASHGHPHDVVIGVGRPAARFQAHAWLDGEPDPDAGHFHELTRLPI